MAALTDSLNYQPS